MKLKNTRRRQVERYFDRMQGEHVVPWSVVMRMQGCRGRSYRW